MVEEIAGNVLLRNYGAQVTATEVTTVLKEVPPLLSEADLHIAQLAMTFLSSVCAARLALDALTSTCLMQVFRLAQSPLLQGGALSAMLGLFKAIVAAEVPAFSQKKLLELLVNPVVGEAGDSIHKQGRASIAKCVAAVVSTQRPAEAAAVVNQFAAQLSGKGGVAHQQTFALLAIGEIGRHM